MEDENELIALRRKKLETLRAKGIEPFGAGFDVSGSIAEVRERFKEGETFRVAGRITAHRDMGKSHFLDLRDATGRIQIYLHAKEVGPELFDLFRLLDIGDFMGVEGTCFVTKSGEPTIKVQIFQLLAKTLRPLPEKWHGLQDVEARYRQRYLDLLTNPQVRETFRKRAQIIQVIRRFFTERDFLEVETPVMQSVAGGALAKPFVTHHRALDIDLYLRIAPELFLKRLVVGGVDRVFELGRNFRNEGMSTKHNPEYTMLEFYQAYATYEHLMTLTEELFAFLAQEVNGGPRLIYGECEVDLTPPWRRLGMKEAVCEYAGLSAEEIEQEDVVRAKARDLGVLPYAAAPLG